MFGIRPVVNHAVPGRVLRPCSGCPGARDRDSRGPRGAPEEVESVMWAAGKYIDWGVVSISLTNLLVILGMIVVFVLAVNFVGDGIRDAVDPRRTDG